MVYRYTECFGPWSFISCKMHKISHSLVHFAADEGPQSETFCIYRPLNYIQLTMLIFHQQRSYEPLFHTPVL